jgi:transposase
MTARELRVYNERTMEVQFLRSDNQWLRGDRNHLGVEVFHLNQQLADAQEQNARLLAENQRLQRQVAELLAARAAGAEEEAGTAPAPPVKVSVVRRRRKRPGRKEGHAAALRPMPQSIDVHQDVPLPRDAAGRPSCPACKACLLDLEDHERIVEDIVPATVLVTCYHTASGWCPSCRKRVESRSREQPPAANLPHGQLGINALATGMLLRVVHRLPFRQVTGVFANLPKLTVCPGAITRQVQRIAKWLQGDYEQLMLDLRSAPHVHADETGWRTDGRNGYLWAAATPNRTLYHVDKSRGGEVIRKLLGKAFGGMLISDFYSAYARMDCKKQKCLAHLLRELTQSAEKSPAFASGIFMPRAKRLIKDMLLLKRRWDQLSDKAYTSSACRLETRLDQLLTLEHDEPNAKRIAKRMRKHRKELTAFLWDKDLDGTNNAAERAIRPAVVARKISGGSRSKNGADAWAKLASLLRTAGQQGEDVLATIKAMLIAAWETGNPALVPKQK